MENNDTNWVEKQSYSIFAERKSYRFTHITIQSNVEINESMIKGRIVHKNDIIYTNKNDNFEFSTFDVVKTKYSSCIAAGFRDLFSLSLNIIFPLFVFKYGLLYDSYKHSFSIYGYAFFLIVFLAFMMQIHFLKFKTIQFILRNGKKIHIPMHDGLILFKEKRNDNWIEFLEAIKKLGMSIT